MRVVLHTRSIDEENGGSGLVVDLHGIRINVDDSSKQKFFVDYLTNDWRFTCRPWRSPALLATLWSGLSGNLSQGHTLELSADRNTVQLQIHGTHNAALLESLVRTLAPLRAETLPGVPADRDHQIKGGANTIMEKQPALSMAVLRGGGFRLWVRNCGLGWLAYEIDNRCAASVSKLIIKHIGTRETPDFANTVSPETGH